MESGTPPPDRPRPDHPETAGSSPEPPATPDAPQAPAGPESPAPAAEAPPGGWQQEVATQQEWSGRPLSGWWRRVGAYILDGIITTLVVYVGVLLIILGSEVIGGIVTVIGIVVAFVYFPVTMSREGERNGQSLGKQALDITVARDTGEPVTFGWALLRQFVVIGLLFQWLGGFLAGLPWLLDVLWPLWDRENRALHDMIVKSHVVHV
jgi:uncharacterized RDD family membrane protein YckC